MEIFLRMPQKQLNKQSQRKHPPNPQNQCQNLHKNYLNSPKRLMNPNQSRKRNKTRNLPQVFSEMKTKILCLGTILQLSSQRNKNPKANNLLTPNPKQKNLKRLLLLVPEVALDCLAAAVVYLLQAPLKNNSIQSQKPKLNKYRNPHNSQNHKEISLVWVLQMNKTTSKRRKSNL